jgi:MFS family permease
MRLPFEAGPLRERNFHLLFLAQATSLLGSAMSPVALSFAVLGLTGSVSDLGFVLAALTVVEVVFLLAGGVAADRLSRRALMVTSELLSCAAQLTAATLLIAGVAHLWQLLLLQTLAGAAAAPLRARRQRTDPPDRAC